MARLVRSTSRAIVIEHDPKAGTHTVKPVDIDSPIRLDRAFWIVYVLIGLPSLLLIRPLLAGEPLTTRVAGAILLPFLVAIVVYTIALLMAAVVFGGPAQRRKFWAFLMSMGAVSAVFLAEWALSGFKDPRWATPAIGSFCGIILYGALSRRSSNRSPDPTLAPEAPPAGQEPPPR
jgi:hypothetical protein